MTSKSKNHRLLESKEILKIFIASSAELNKEREKIILIFNSMNKYLNHLKLEPVKWETNIESGNVEKERGKRGQSRKVHFYRSGRLLQGERDCLQ